MSAYSTLRITRDRAIRYLVDAVYTAPDADLADLLDHFIEQRLYKAQVVGDSEENDNAQL